MEEGIGSNNKFQSEIARRLKEKTTADLEKKNHAEANNGNGVNGNGEKIAVDLDNNGTLKKREERIKQHAMSKLNGQGGQRAERLNFIREQANAQLRTDDAGRKLSQEERSIKAKEIKRGAQKNMERKLSKTMGKGKAKLASRAVGEAAYRIATKLQETANRGGHWAILVFIITLVIALIIDALDIAGEFLIETIIGTIIVFLINFCLSLIIMFFWTFVLGGGHPKWFWKRVIRMLVGFFAVEAIPILELFPFTTFIVCWNWHDFQKERNEAKEQLQIIKSNKK